jgi:hypothetical protein
MLSTSVAALKFELEATARYTSAVQVSQPENIGTVIECTAGDGAGKGEGAR